MIKLPQEWLYDTILDECSNEEQGIEFVEKEKENIGHKCIKQNFIFKYNDKFYIVEVIKQGNNSNWERYTDDYCTLLRDAEELHCYEVEKIQIVKHAWKLV